MWSIILVKNDLKISKKCAEALLGEEGTDGYYDGECAGEYGWEGLSDLFDANSGKLVFNSDHFEHMDFVWRVWKVLAEHEAKGEIVFASAEGDNKGEAWSYRFDGKGAFEHRQGKLKDALAGKLLKKTKIPSWW